MVSASGSSSVPAPDDLGRFLPAASAKRRRASSRMKSAQHLLEPQVHAPELGVVERQHLVPEAGLVQPRRPSPRPRCSSSSCHDRARHPGGQVHAVGDVADRHRLPGPVRARGRARCCATPGRGGARRRSPARRAGSRSTVMWNWLGDRRDARRAGRAARGRSPISSQTGPGARLELLDREGVVARRHRRVGGEHAVRAHLRARRPRTACPAATSSRSRSIIMNAACPSLACHTRGLDARGRAAPARRRRRGSTPAGGAAPGRRRRACSCSARSSGWFDLEVGVEQVDRHPADHHAPGPHVHRAAGGLDHREPRLAVAARSPARAACRRDVELLVAVLLPAVEPDPLVEVALHVEEADADQRARRGRTRPCSDRPPGRRGRRSRSAPSCAARTRRRSRRPAGRRARAGAARTRCRSLVSCSLAIHAMTSS